MSRKTSGSRASFSPTQRKACAVLAVCVLAVILTFIASWVLPGKLSLGGSGRYDPQAYPLDTSLGSVLAKTSDAGTDYVSSTLFVGDQFAKSLYDDKVITLDQFAGKDGLTFKALVSVRPEVKLGTYKGLTASKDVAKVTDKDVDEELKPYIDRATRLVSVDRAAQNGDTVVIDFEGFDNGEAFDGGKGENYDLKLGAGMFVPGFEEQLVGAKAGEEKDLDITFPEDYHPGLAGKAVVFHVKVKEVKEPQAPVVDDEFAKDVSEFETMDAFRKSLAEKIADRRSKQADADFENQVLEQLIENMECEIPDGMVDVQLDRLMEDYAMRLQSQGSSMEDYQKMMGVNGDIVRESARPSALRQVQMQLALTAVADAENIEVTDEEVQAEIDRLAKQYNIDVEQVKAAVPVEDLKKDLRLRKASDLVIAEAKVGKAKKKAAAKKTEKVEGTEGEEKPKKAPAKKAAKKEEKEAE